MLEDVYATVLSAAGVKVPEESYGVNLLPSAISGEEETRAEVHGEFGRGAMLKFMLRWGEYKYIYHTNGGLETLFDLGNDPNELRNIASEHVELCKECRDRIKEYYLRNGFEEAVDGEELKRYEYRKHKPRGFLNQAPRWESTVHR